MIQELGLKLRCSPNMQCQLSELHCYEPSMSLTDLYNNYARNWFYCISIPGLRYIFTLPLCTINLEYVCGESVRLLWVQWNSLMNAKIISFPSLKLRQTQIPEPKPLNFDHLRTWSRCRGEGWRKANKRENILRENIRGHLRLLKMAHYF